MLISALRMFTQLPNLGLNVLQIHKGLRPLLRDEQKRPETFLDLKSIQAKIRELCEYTEC